MRDRTHRCFSLTVGLGVLTSCTLAFAQPNECGFVKAFDRPDEGGKTRVSVYEARQSAVIGSRALAFVTSLKVNTDGTRVSYKADDPRGQDGAINDIRNAYNDPSRPISDFEAIRDANWKPTHRVWQVLGPSIIERDKRLGRVGRPCIGHDNYLVSMTADVAVNGGFNRSGDCDQTKWIDALTIPGIVLPRSPSQFEKKGARTRSVAVAMSLKDPFHIAYGIVGDIGPSDELGEASVEMNRILNGLPEGARPRTYDEAKAHFQAGRSIVVLFPGAANRLDRPITPARVTKFVTERFAAWGGESRLKACLKEIPEANQ
jgi:hypothetical protein